MPSAPLFAAAVACSLFLLGLILKKFDISLWWLMPALFLCLVVAFYTVPISQQLPTTPPGESHTPALPTIAPSPTPAVRIHLDTTPNEIAGLYATKTAYQADLVVGGYRGKWMDVEGELNETSADRFDPTTMTVLAFYGDRREKNHTLMSLTFSRSKFESALSSITKGAKLAATCQFDAASEAGVLLSNCELRPITPLPR